MLNEGRVATRLPAQDLDRARAFYAEKLGLHPVEEREGGLRYVVAAGEFALFESAGAASGDHTQMGWEVDDIEATVTELRSRGVLFEEYDLLGFGTKDGIADIEGQYPSKGTGERAVWFHDSEGNLLGIGQPHGPRLDDRPAADGASELETLVGRWRTEGATIETPDSPALRIDAVDTYEWLPGHTSLLHRVDARVGDEQVAGAEIIGWDPERNAYVTQYFGTDGPNAYEASLTEEEGGLVWAMRSATDRFTGTFSDDGDTITGHWEQLDSDERWRPWMEVTLRRGAKA